MTQLNSVKLDIEYEQNMSVLAHIKKEFQNTTLTNPEKFEYLGIELCNLMERVLISNDTKTQQMMETQALDQMQENTSEDNFDLDKESVKKIILKEISVNPIFYPSDIANQYNLDLEIVMDIMSELKENKQITENLE